MHSRSSILRPAATAAVLVLLALPVVSTGTAASVQSKQSDEGSLTELDRFMARVLERREETWKTLHDYVLDEVERFELVGPGEVRLHGMNREFTWYVRDGYFVRSPTRFDGVILGEDERRDYERRWLEDERRREGRAKEEQEANPSLDGFVTERGEPRFVSEAYFLKFKFEPGNYYFAGREEVGGRSVVKIEYYPTRLYSDEEEKERRQGDKQASGQTAGGREQRRGRQDPDEDRELGRKLNKVALVTLWIDPAEHQIVRYTFDNVDFGFLPGRWLVRVDEISASMDMKRVFEGVWLPENLSVRGGFSLATGGYTFSYGRRFSDYRKAEVRARIRDYKGGVDR